MSHLRLTNHCSFLESYEMRCAIWYHLYNLKNVKNTHGGVLILVKLQALAKSRNAPHMRSLNLLILEVQSFQLRTQ